MECAERAPAPLQEADVAKANYIEVARAFLAGEIPVEVGDAPNRESYLAAVALAGDPGFRELARDGDIESAADRIRAKVLQEMPEVEGLYKSLLLNALDGVSFCYLAQELRARN
jgi:hypothetical protein